MEFKDVPIYYLQSTANLWLHKFPAIKDKIEQAALLLLFRNISLKNRQWVLSDRNTHYTIQNNQCECPGAQRGNTCKHKIAVALLCTVLLRANLQNKRAKIFIAYLNKFMPQL